MTKERLQEIKQWATEPDDAYGTRYRFNSGMVRECIAEIERLEAACREKDERIECLRPFEAKLFPANQRITELEATVERLRLLIGRMKGELNEQHRREVGHSYEHCPDDCPVAGVVKEAEAALREE